MNKLYFFLIICFLISCKKEVPKTKLPSKKIPAIIITDERTVEIDTALISSFKSETLKQFYTASENKTVWGNLQKEIIFYPNWKNQMNWD